MPGPERPRITGIGEATQDTSQLGQVFVQLYHDGESGSDYVPIKYAVAIPSSAGTAFLGSESDYIIKADSVTYFGGGYYEADLTGKC